MATILNIRLGNICLDGGDKIIPSNVYSFKGLNSLFILENGGGKTSVISLILQTILPNSVTGSNKRSLMDTVQKGKNGHVSVEWKVDKEGKHRVCTGFSFDNRKSAQDDSHSLRFFTYIIEYYADQFRATDLPFFIDKDGRKFPTPYEVYRQKLREERKVKVQIYNSSEVTRYKNDLRSHGIIPEEWENIRKINVSEGAADKFFEKSTEVDELLTRLFIPSIDEAIFSSTGSESTLSKAFFQYQQNLLRLPEIQKNIQDFNIVENHTEEVIQSVQDYEESRQKVIKQNIHLLRLIQTLDDEVKTLIETKTANIEKLKEVEFKLKDLAWKIDSYQYNVTSQELESEKEQNNDLTLKYNSAAQKVKELDLKIKQLEAMEYYRLWEDAKNLIISLQEKIDSLELNHEDLEEKVTEWFKKTSSAWNQQYRALEEKYGAIKEELKTLEDNISVQKTERKSLAGQLNETTINIGVYQNWITSYQSKMSGLTEWFEEWDLLDPKSCLTRVENELKEQQLIKDDGEKAYKQAISVKGQLFEEEKELNRKIWDFNNKIDSLKKWLNEAKESKDQVEALLNQYGHYVPENQNEKDDITMFISLRKEDKNKEIYGLELKKVEKEQLLQQLNETNYFVPHNGLTRIKNFLEQQGLMVVLGSEWLAEHNITEKEKAEIYDANPLLPYSIVVTSTQLKAITKAVNKYHHLEKAPIVFIEKESLAGLKEDVAKEGKLISTESLTWIYQGLDLELFINDEKMKEMKETVIAKIQSLKQSISELKTQELKLTTSLNTLQNYWDTYFVPYNQQMGSLGEHQSKFKSLQDEQNLITSQMETQNSIIKNWEERKDSIDKTIQAISIKLSVTSDWYKLSLEEPEKSKELTRLKKLKKELTNRFDECEKSIEQLEKLYRDNFNQKLEMENRLQRFRDEKKKYDWSSETLNEEFEYESIKTSYIAAKELLESRQRNKTELMEQLKREKRNQKNLEKIIEEKDIEISWLQEHYRLVPEEEIKEEKNALKKLKEEKSEFDRKLKDSNTKKLILETQLEEQKKAVFKNHDEKEPYIYRDFQEKTQFISEYDKLECQKQELNQSIINAVQKIEECHNSREVIIEVIPDNSEELEHYSVRPWEGSIITYIRFQKSEYLNCSNELEDRKGNVELVFSQFQRKLSATQNLQMNQFSRQLDVLLSEGRIFDYEYVIKKFTEILEMFDHYREQEETKKMLAEKDQKELIDMCYSRVQAVFEKIKEIPINSKMNLYGKDYPAITLKWDHNDEEVTKQNLTFHIYTIIEGVKDLRSDGEEEQSVMNFIQEQLDITMIMPHYAPYSGCVIKVFKPKKEEFLKERTPKYEFWEIASKWSGGERYTVYMIMFMVYISHIRQMVTGRGNGSLSIIVDNPFGAASDDHVIDPVIEIANKNNIQLICLTAHKPQNIIKKFPVVYSNVYRFMGGKEILDYDAIQTLESLNYTDNEQLNLL